MLIDPRTRVYFSRRPRTVILAGVGKFAVATRLFAHRTSAPIAHSLPFVERRCCSTLAPRSSSPAAPPRRLGSFGRSGASARTLRFASIMEVIAQAWGSWDAAVSGATFATLRVRRARVSSARRAITRPPASLSIRSARRRPDERSSITMAAVTEGKQNGLPCALAGLELLGRSTACSRAASALRAGRSCSSNAMRCALRVQPLTTRDPHSCRRDAHAQLRRIGDGLRVRGAPRVVEDQRR